MVGRLWTHKGETRAVIVRDGAFAIPELQGLHDITIDDGGNIIIDPTDP